MSGFEISILALCTLPLALIGGWLLNAAMFNNLKELTSAQTWRSVNGRITDSKAVGQRELKGGVIYYPHVKYEYRVDGQTYENTKIHAGGGLNGIRHEETVRQNVTRDYPVGKEVQVYYKPTNPAEATLHKKNPLLVFIFLPLALAFDIGLIYYVLWLAPQALELLK